MGGFTGLPTSAIVKIVKCRRANVQNDTTSPAFIPSWSQSLILREKEGLALREWACIIARLA